MDRERKNIAPDAKYIYVFLFREDVIQQNDLIRETVLRKESSESDINWEKAHDAIPSWVGKPVGLFFEHLGENYEFIRAIALKDI